MNFDPGRYRVKIAETRLEREAAQRLRYRVFVEEMGADANEEQRRERREWDRFDPWFDHLILIDTKLVVSDPPNQVVGVYRLMRDTAARKGVGFYSASEYDLGRILDGNRPAVELGRSCVAPEHRGGVSMHLLWNGLAEYVLVRRIEILFGVGSFPGTDPTSYADALSFLAESHLAPLDLRVEARPEGYVDMSMRATQDIDRIRAALTIPPLIKSYLRLGGFVGQGAYVDKKFNTVDVCIIMDTMRMTERYRRFYDRQLAPAT